MNFENDNPNYKPNTSDKRSRITNPTPYTGLGKLPPQATDLEEAVLGALMLEKDALSSVIDILKPEVFTGTITRKYLRRYNTCSKNITG
nr:DnaB-like helicase N-terminal domain-containing protein [Mucilaginibacter humi]